MKGKSSRFVLVLLLSFLFIAQDALGAPASERGLQVTPAAPPSFTELYRNSLAVIIGVNRYDKWPSLEYAVNDAKAMEAKLKALGFETTTLIDHNATKGNILRILGDQLPRRVDKDDRVVIFFAGHGQTEELADGSQLGYIVPVDADTQDLFSTAISMDQVRDFSRRLKAKHVLYLMDSCYSGLGLSRSGTLPPGDRDYLRKITTRKAHQMITAGGKGEQAKEEGAHGLFTKYVLEALDGQADRDGKGFITFSDLAAYVKPKVSREAGNSQTPQYGNIAGEGEFVFVTGKVGTDAADSREADALDAESRKIQSEKQKLAAERSRLAALKEQQAEKARIAEEMRRLEEEKEKLRQEEEQRASFAKKALEEKQRKIAEEKARLAAEQEAERLATEQRRLEEERASFAKQKAMEEKRRKIAEERERLAIEQEAERLAVEERKQPKTTTTLAMATRPSQTTNGEIARDGRFIAYGNGTVLDTSTNLMWAAKDNGVDIQWSKAKPYCENYRGGGYTDWRMPTRDELAGLYDSGKTSRNPPTEGCNGGYHVTELIHLTCANLWSSEENTSGTGPRWRSYHYFNFSHGFRNIGAESYNFFIRALPVRSGK